MPARQDIKKIFIIGSGPIVIGQACEFDYSGTQACKVLKEIGYKIILLNSNPATIMTDPKFADKTYIEPISIEFIEKIIELEKPDAILPTLGGQTALNAAIQISESGLLEKYNIEMIGVTYDVIQLAENRELFKKAMLEINLDVPKSYYISNLDEALNLYKKIDFPAIVRPSFTLGGTGAGIAYNNEEFEFKVKKGLDLSPMHQVLIEESVIGWKEIELEIMRDSKDNVVIVCSIENLDPMGVHTGDSITVAPVQTLTDKEYQMLRDAAIRAVRKIGVNTGGANIQFAINPENGKMVVIEVNPRVSRSSALASKATGFPIAKIAAKLAVGYSLDEIHNDITKKTLACFEPALDYVVVKIPRWDMIKFPETEDTLTTQMKSVGETMAIGRTFKEALQKAIRSLEIGRDGLGGDGKDTIDPERLMENLIRPNPERLFYIRYAIQSGMEIRRLADLTKIDPWFLHNIEQIVNLEGKIRAFTLKTIPNKLLLAAKKFGFSDRQLAFLLKTKEKSIRFHRKKLRITPVFKTVDTCAGEFEAYTPYYYSTYEEEDELIVSHMKKIVILGGGPNRIGQGIEFDYCCVHACQALSEEDIETIMINNNPETVSTDYDVSHKLFFEPLTSEDILNIIDRENPDGVIVHLGGQTPLNLTSALIDYGLKIIGTSPESIDLAEDRKRFGKLLKELNITQPPHGFATSAKSALEAAKKIGYPVLVRPSYVLGGRAMMIIYDDDSLKNYMINQVKASSKFPVLIDKFLEDAFEFDVDAISDDKDVMIGGIMQHIEEAGVHSGDSACVMPPYMISNEQLGMIKEYTYSLCKKLHVVGLINIQFAIKNDVIYVLEVNPRASRTIPFVSKTIGTPLAKLAAKVMIGIPLRKLKFNDEIEIPYIAVKEAIMPFSKFSGIDIILGPEMRSTGEVMGIADTFGEAYAKSQISCGQRLPLEGKVLISVNNNDKEKALQIGKKLHELGFKILATTGTSKFFTENGLPTKTVYKVKERRPNLVDHIKNNEIQLIINTPLGKESYFEETAIRKASILYNVPCITTLSGALAACSGIEEGQSKTIKVKCIQDYHKQTKSYNENEYHNP